MTCNVPFTYGGNEIAPISTWLFHMYIATNSDNIFELFDQRKKCEEFISLFNITLFIRKIFYLWGDPGIRASRRAAASLQVGEESSCGLLSVRSVKKPARWIQSGRAFGLGRRSLLRVKTGPAERDGAGRAGSYRPKSESPRCASGRRPNGQVNLRSAAAMGCSLMLAMRRRMRPSASNSQFSLP